MGFRREGSGSEKKRLAHQVAMAALAATLAFVVSACGGGSGGDSGEGKGYPGDTNYAADVIKPYYVNNNLIDPPVPPGTLLPRSVSNVSRLGSLPVANQEQVGACAAVSFAQAIYAADAAAGSMRPLLDNVQYSYLFARFYESQTGGSTNYLKDSGSYAYTNFRALTNQEYFSTYTNGHLPLDGPEESFPDVWTGIFYPPWHGPSIEQAPNGYWNDVNLWKDLATGPTSFSITIRSSGLTASSLDVKARLNAGNLVWFAMATNDVNDQFDNNIKTTGLMDLPFTKPSNPEANLGGHAMVIVGYNDALYNGEGGFVVRNSWGTDWGDPQDPGYWYLPYQLVDRASGSGARGDWPIYQDENYVYISSISHN
jgi:hypothetical protein